MKKLLLISLTIVAFTNCAHTQWLNLFPINHLTYYSENATNKQMLILDSLLFNTKHGGLEQMNLNDFSISYHWNGYYKIKSIVADTGNSYVYLRNNNYIGRLNPSTQEYENIWPDGLQNRLKDIDVATDGKVWAVTVFTNKIAIFDGTKWEEHDYSQYSYNGFNKINLVNDTLAFVSSGTSQFFAFHNGVFDSIYVHSDVKDWDVDSNGNLWIAANSELIHYYNGTATIYDETNTPIGTNKFDHIKIGSDGHVWVSGVSKKLLEFNGADWQVHSLPSNYVNIENFALDQQNHPMVITNDYYQRQVYTFDGNSWTTHLMPFYPISDLKAIGINNSFNPPTGFFANDEGIFKVNLNNFSILDFKDTSDFKYANKITRFTDYDPSKYFPSYGTPYGVYGLTGFKNTQLPNLHINHIFYNNGTYYIATDSGLVAYNGILYNIINTSNSPLPSDKITFVTSGNYCDYNYQNNGLYIGTDKGVAIYRDAQWIVYDSTNIPIDNFNVTGILAPCPTEDTYISTLGSGLIKISSDGTYELFNTSNGNMLDDTLYYVKYVELSECGQNIVLGTRQNGIIYFSIWEPDQFNYITNYGGVAITSSTMAVNGSDLSIVATDTLNYLLSPCGIINKASINRQLKWFQQGSLLYVLIPENLYGSGNIKLLDMLGRVVIEEQTNIQSGKTALNVGNLTTGVYVFRISNGKKFGFAKVVVSNYDQR